MTRTVPRGLTPGGSPPELLGSYLVRVYLLFVRSLVRRGGSGPGGSAAQLQPAGYCHYWEALRPGPLTVPTPRPKGTVSVAALWPRAATVPVALHCFRVSVGRCHTRRGAVE